MKPCEKLDTSQLLSPNLRSRSPAKSAFTRPSPWVNHILALFPYLSALKVFSFCSFFLLFARFLSPAAALSRLKEVLSIFVFITDTAG